MPPTLAGLLQAPVRDEVVLLELTPRLVLQGFGATDDTTAVYETPLARLEMSGGMPAGVYRRVVGVRENATPLDAETSVEAVEAAPGSWYWDEAAETLYVHTSGGGNPDTYTAYQALVRFYVATRPVVLNRETSDPDTGIYHHPWVIGGLPELIERDNDNLFGAKVMSGVDLQLLNTHGFWFEVVAHNGSYRWKNAQVSAWLGGSYAGGVLPRSAYLPIFSMLVDDVTANEELLTLALKPLAARLNELVPRTPYFEGEYPHAGDGVRGTTKWVGYGRTTMRPDLTDTTSHGIYTIADAAFQTLFAVHQAWAVNRQTGARTTLSAGTDYTVDLTACTLTVVNATYAHATHLIEVDVTGKPDGSGSYLQTFADIVQDLLTTFAGVRAADIDTASIAAANTAAPEEMSVWLKNRRSLASILSTAEDGFPALESAIGGSVMQTPDGTWRVDIWDPGFDPTSVPTFRQSEFAQFSPEPVLQSIFSAVHVYYGYNHATGEWRVTQASSARTEYLNDVADVLQVFTFLRGDLDADRLAAQVLFVAGGIQMSVDVEETGARLAVHSVRDKLLVNYAPAPVIGGALSSALFEVVELRRSFEPTLRVTARLGNVRGIGGTIGRWVDDLAPDWDDATDEERAVSGFWTDDSDLPDPGDPLSAGGSRWW
ncbi:MAG: hypothetical protein Q8L86_10050 [Vicinamibacterales bacterium]|nr:hypothetical protein [Vicinamibacterales bacterium]